MASEHELRTFKSLHLIDTYLSEGISSGDLNRDGHLDIVYGPIWFEGPDFTTTHEIAPAAPQSQDSYAEMMLSWVHDVNGDGWNDVITVGAPGTPAYLSLNPANSGGNWTKSVILPRVTNESPHLVDLNGDGQPELVCTVQGRFGFATFNPAAPLDHWTFHVISDRSAREEFGHGLGVGDLNNDGRPDIITAGGWFEHPTEGATAKPWKFHSVSFTRYYGGAQMHVYDVDGDGDQDVITSEAAHDFGLSWYEQIQTGDGPEFKRHVILGQTPEENPYGLVISEMHSVALADIDGDGLQDILTGKTYLSRHRSSPQWDSPPVFYWFKLQRTPEGVKWTPWLISNTAGIGRQITVTDINQDGSPDLLVGGMKGAHLFVNSPKKVSEAEWKEAQPKLRTSTETTTKTP